MCSLIKIQATPPPAEGVIQASTQLHKAVIINITIANPIAERLGACCC